VVAVNPTKLNQENSLQFGLFPNKSFISCKNK